MSGCHCCSTYPAWTLLPFLRQPFPLLFCGEFCLDLHSVLVGIVQLAHQPIQDFGRLESRPHPAVDARYLAGQSLAYTACVIPGSCVVGGCSGAVGADFLVLFPRSP